MLPIVAAICTTWCSTILPHHLGISRQNKDTNEYARGLATLIWLHTAYFAAKCFSPFTLLVAVEFRSKTVRSVLQSPVGIFTRLAARNVASFRVANHFFDPLPSCPPAPMNHVKYLRAGPAEMPFRNWYTANINHFHLTDSVRWK